MMGGPQVIATVFSGEGATSLSTVGTNPTRLSHPGYSASTVRIKLTSDRASHSFNSSL